MRAGVLSAPAIAHVVVHLCGEHLARVKVRVTVTVSVMVRLRLRLRLRLRFRVSKVACCRRNPKPNPYP